MTNVVTAEAFLEVYNSGEEITFEKCLAIDEAADSDLLTESTEELSAQYGELPETIKEVYPRERFVDRDISIGGLSNLTCGGGLDFITFATIERETEKAYKVSGDLYVGRGSLRTGRVGQVQSSWWVPKSQVAVIKDDIGDTCVYLKPWLANKMKSESYKSAKSAWRGR